MNQILIEKHIYKQTKNRSETGSNLSLTDGFFQLGPSKIRKFASKTDFEIFLNAF